MKDKYKTQQTLAFQTDRSEFLQTRLLQVVLDDRNQQEPSICILTIGVDYPAYQRIRQQGWFNLLADQWLVGSESELEEREVEIGLRLKPALLSDLLEQAESAEAIAHYLISLESGNSLLRTESWLATEFVQVTPLPPELADSGELRSGYQTLWAHPEQLKKQLLSQIPLSMKTVVLQFLQENDLAYEVVNDTLLRLQLHSQEGEWVCLVSVNEAENQCAVYSVYPNPVPEEWRKACAIFLAHVNYDLLIGNFEIDLEDGDLRYRTAISLGQGSLTPALFEQLLTHNVNTMDRYFSKLRDFQGFEAGQLDE